MWVGKKFWVASGCKIRLKERKFPGKLSWNTRICFYLSVFFIHCQWSANKLNNNNIIWALQGDHIGNWAWRLLENICESHNYSGNNNAHCINLCLRSFRDIAGGIAESNQIKALKSILPISQIPIWSCLAKSNGTFPDTTSIGENWLAVCCQWKERGRELHMNNNNINTNNIFSLGSQYSKWGCSSGKENNM